MNAIYEGFVTVETTMSGTYEGPVIKSTNTVTYFVDTEDNWLCRITEDGIDTWDIADKRWYHMVDPADIIHVDIDW